MIRPLRARHRLVMTVLAVVLPVSVALGLKSRPALPPTSGPNPALSTFAPSGKGPFEVQDRLWSEANLWEGQLIATELWRRDDEARITLDPLEDLRAPDLLLYWTERAEVPTAVPNEAQWLGRLRGTDPQSYVFPLEAVGAGGRLILFSLGHQRVISSAALPREGGTGES